MTTLTGDEGNNTLIGGSDHDTLRGLGGDDILLGGDGWDWFYGDAGNDTIDGQGDTNIVFYSAAPAGVTVNLTTGIASDGYGGTDTLRNIQNVEGTRFNDSLTGNSQDNYFWGVGGDDLIDGLGGNDWASYKDVGVGVTVNLTTGVAEDGSGGTSTLRNIENIYGTRFDDNLTGNEQNNRLDGLDGSNLIDGRGGYDTVYYCSEWTGATVNLTTGKAIHNGATDTLISIEGIYASGFNDNLTGSAEANYFWGNGGNDTFCGLGGNDTIDGGDGLDTAIFGGLRANSTLTKTVSGWTISSSSDGTDTLANVERLQFSDGTIAVDIGAGQNAGEAYRLYQAAFARTPDIAGVKYHLNDLEANGMVLHDIASHFLASPEFATKYGTNPTDTQYINALYHNVLNRAPGDSEVSWYQNQFNTHQMDHEAALIGFSESPENVALVGTQIANGIWLG